MIRAVESVIAGYADRARARQDAKIRADATPPPPGLHADRPWISPGRPPWIKAPHADVRALLARFLDDVADAIAPPPGQTIARRLDTPRGGEPARDDEDDDE